MLNKTGPETKGLFDDQLYWTFSRFTGTADL
jgi:hypothetical protein